MQEFIAELIKRKTAILLSLAGLFILLSIGSVVYANILLSYPNIYQNIYINDVNIGGLNKEDAKKVLENKYTGFANDKSISLVYEGLSHSVDLNVLNIEPDIEKTVEKAFAFAREGSSFTRFYNILKTSFSSVVLPLEIEYQQQRLSDDILIFSSKIDNMEKMFEIDEENELLKIDIEKTDKLIDIAMTNQNFVSHIKNASFDEVSPIFVSTDDPKSKAELLYNRIARTSSDATMTVKDGVITYIDEQSGIDFDKEELYSRLRSERGEISLSIKVSKPEITVEILKSRSFDDTLGAFTTYYDSSIIGRSQNVRMAAQKMNQYIVPPGSEFSFNKVVGKRTVDAGFAIGKIFMGEEMVDDVGGGICQVSSTLYAAVLKANMKVVERHNHKFSVSYMPNGQDATVSYGYLDFRFSNNTKYPVKIVSSASGGRMSIQLMGTQTYPDQTIEILNVTKSTSTFATREKENPDPTAKAQVVQQGGMNGAVVDSYKIIKQNGVEVSRSFLHTSVYVPMDRIILIPKSKQETEVEQAEKSPTPSPSATAVIPTNPAYDTPIVTIPPHPETTPLRSIQPDLENEN